LTGCLLASAGLLSGLFCRVHLLGSSSSGILCLLSSLYCGVLRHLPTLSSRLLPQGVLPLLGDFLEAWREAPCRLADLIYRLACGVLHSLRGLPNLLGRSSSYFPNLFGRSSSYFPNLLGRSCSYLPNLLGRSSSYFPNLLGRSSSHFPNLLGRSCSYLPNLLGRSSSHFPNLLGRSCSYLPNLLGYIT
jgi:hypothetical protein